MAPTTIINCIGATGQVLAPHVVFNGKALSDNNLNDASTSGLSNSKILQNYLGTHFLNRVPTTQHASVLVLFDGHRSHVNAPLIEWALDHNIILFMLPAYTSIEPSGPTNVLTTRRVKTFFMRILDGSFSRVTSANS